MEVWERQTVWMERRSLVVRVRVGRLGCPAPAVRRLHRPVSTHHAGDARKAAACRMVEAAACTKPQNRTPFEPGLGREAPGTPRRSESGRWSALGFCFGKHVGPHGGLGGGQALHPFTCALRVRRSQVNQRSPRAPRPRPPGSSAGGRRPGPESTWEGQPPLPRTSRGPSPGLGFLGITTGNKCGETERGGTGSPARE